MRTAARIVLTASLLLPAGISASSVAHAQATAPSPTSQATKDEAQDRFKRGIQLYEEESFPAALVEFRRAYELVPAFQVLYNVARTCYQVRDYVCALRTFDRYLADGGTNVEPRRRDEVEREMASMRRRVVTLNVKSTKGATILVDGVAKGDFPLTAPLLVNEGRRQLRATLAGHEAVEKMVDLVGGETTTVDLVVADSSAGVAGGGTGTGAPIASTTSRSNLPVWLWGATGVLAVGAGVTGVVALAASSDASDIRGSGGKLADYDSSESRMRTFSVVTDVLALAAVGVGVAALVVTLSQPEAKSSVTGSLRRSPSGGLLRYGL